MEFVLTLGEAFKGMTEQPTPEDLKFVASLYLIPLEYQTLNRIIGPQCAGMNGRQRSASRWLATNGVDPYPPIALTSHPYQNALGASCRVHQHEPVSERECQVPPEKSSMPHP
jgi:hypothetical protein